jgi:hypothetical protein
MTSKNILSAAIALAMLTGVSAAYAQTPCVPTHYKHKKHEPAPAPCDTSDLKKQLDAQQAELDALKAKLAAMPTTSQEVDPIATPIANKAESDAQSASSSAAAASATATAAQTAADKAAADAAVAKKEADELQTPSAIHYKGVLIQPGGFAAAESVYRSRATNSDIATPFNAIPYMNSNNAFLSEFNGSVRQSRLSLNVTAPMSWGKAGAYFETDFLGAGTTSNNNQTNSYVLRVRSAFGYVTFNNGFTFQGGQMFTLATEDKKGVLAGPGAEALPPTIDPNYIVGFNFGRQYGLRFAQSFAGGTASAALSIEGSQIILANTPNAPGNFVFGGAGSGGGLFNSTNNYTTNLAPDILAKVAFDPKGLGHYEIGGILRFFRDRVYPQTTFVVGGGGVASAAFNQTTPGGGFFASARLPITKYFDFGLKVAGGDGTGRYGAANLGDVTVRPSGLLEPLRDGQGLSELDIHPTKKLDLFALGGVEYLQRTSYLNAAGTYTGYGDVHNQADYGCNTQTSPSSAGGVTPAVTGNCVGNIRVEKEGVVGMTYRFFSSPTKGRFQAQLIYSYINRVGWTGYTNGTSFATATTFGAPKATENMIHTSFRYYLP